MREIRFGPFCLRPAAHLLLEVDAPIHIGARALELLIILVERAGEVVTKDELFARVWPGLTVEEGNLRTQVALVRKALRDGQSGARYLMTVPGRGYRFVAPISTTETPEPIRPQAPPTESASGLSTRLTRLIGRADAVSDIVARLSKVASSRSWGQAASARRQWPWLSLNRLRLHMTRESAWWTAPLYWARH